MKNKNNIFIYLHLHITIIFYNYMFIFNDYNALSQSSNKPKWTLVDVKNGEIKAFVPCTFFYFLFHAGKEHQKKEKKTHQEITHLLNRKYTTPHYTSHPKLRYELGIISFSTEKSTRICTSMRSRYSQTTTSTPYFNNFANFQVLRIL